ncbi:MAG: VanZ family protein [Pseudomonadota bacterium]|nr:VanZ family protein [Pseudomonadota bacterium]
MGSEHLDSKRKNPDPAESLLRAFHRPRLWVLLGVGMVGLVMLGSLLPARDLPPVPFNGFDKVQHLLGYAALSTYAVMLFARPRMQAICAVGLVVLGVGLEFAQASMTNSRQADPADALFNSLGVLAGLLVAATPLAALLQRVDCRLWGQARG